MKNFFKSLIPIFLLSAFVFGTAVFLNPQREGAMITSDSENLGGGGGTINVLPIKTFLGLNDTPDSYTGEALDLVRVNAGETALEFVTGSSLFASTLADVSTFSTDATKSRYTMASTIPVEFRRSGGSSLLYLDETNGRIGIAETSPDNQLHLYTNTAVAGTTGIKIENIATNGYANLSFTTDAGTAQFVASGSTYSNGALRGSAFNVYSPGANGIVMESASATGQFQIVTGGNAASNIRVTVNETGKVGIGTTTPTYPLDIVNGSANLPSLRIADVATNATDKIGVIAGRHYLSAEEDVLGFWFSNLSSGGRLIFGGGGSSYNAVNSQLFYTGNGSAVTTGTLAMAINGTQDVSIGAGTSPSARLHLIKTTEQFRVGYDASNYAAFTVSSAGLLGIIPTGTGVGIGTNTPVSKLHVSTGSAADAGEVIMVIGGTAGSDARTGRIIKNTTTPYEMTIRSGDFAGTGVGSDLKFQTNNGDGDRMVIKGGTGNVGIGIAAPTHKLDVSLTSSSTGVSASYFLRSVTSGTISSGSSINGTLGQLAISGSTTISVITATAGNYIAEHDGSSTVHQLIGLRGQARTNAASTGVLASAISILAVAPNNAQAGNTITNAYSLYIESPTAGTTLNYGLYQTGSAANYFGGNVGIGVTAPTSVLHLKAGTATASTAPLKFTSGTKLTAIEAGAMEYNGNFLLNNATLRFPVGGVLFDYYTDTSVGGAEADIYTSTTAASTLNANGDKIIAAYSGNFVTVGTELTQLKVYFAGTAIWDSTGVAPTTGTTSWSIDVKIIRVSATVVRYTVTLNTTGASGYVYAVSGELTGLTLSNTNILKVTGTSTGVGSGAGDIVGKSGYVEFKPGA